LERVLERCERALRMLLAALLAFITVGVFVQVCLRYLFSVAFLWAEELSLFAFIWCIFLGAAVAARHQLHFSLDILARYFHGRAAGWQRLAIDLLVLGFSVVMVAQGYVFSALSLKRFSPALGITLVIPTLVIPLSGAIMIVVTAARLPRHLRRIRTGRDA
jgi:TRAP-type C4-dicarboxylate transport system permease small subunit